MECSALHSLTWLTPYTVHIFVICSNLVCLDSVDLLFCALKMHLLIDVLKTTHGDPWRSLLLLVCGRLVTDLKEHLTLLMEIAFGPVLVHLLRLSEWNSAVTDLGMTSCCWGLWYNNRQEGADLIYISSQHLLYICIYMRYGYVCK